MKNVLVVLTAFVVIGLFCIGCEKAPNEVSKGTEDNLRFQEPIS